MITTRQSGVWTWWENAGLAAPADHREMYYALRKYAEKKYKGKQRPMLPLLYAAATTVIPARVAINNIRPCDENVAWDLFQQFKMRPYAVGSAELRPLVPDVSELGPAPASSLGTEMGAMRVERSLHALSHRLRCAEDVDRDEDDPMIGRVAKKSGTLLNKLIDELALFALSETYPSPPFISAVMRHTTQLLKQVKGLRKPLTAEAREVLLRTFVAQCFDLVVALALCPKGPVGRVMEYKHRST